MKKKSVVSIIVLNYNGLHFLKPCLKSIELQTYPYLEIIVVDNFSKDGSQSYVKRQKGVKLVENPDNYGYAKANNIAAKQASGKFLFFLNNDTELFPDTIKNLVNCYRPKSILAPAQIITANKAKDKHGSPGGGMDIFGYSYTDLESSKTKPFFADGAAIFIGKSNFFDIGQFDQELFIFHEDVDLSWRAQIFGYKIIRCWNAKLYHYSGGVVIGGARAEKGLYTASFFRLYLNQKNVVRNLIKNYSLPFCALLLPMLILIHFSEIIILTLLGQFGAINCYLRAYSWNIRNLKETLAYRKKVQKKRKVSDLVLLRRMYFAYSKLTALYRLGLPKFV